MDAAAVVSDADTTAHSHLSSGDEGDEGWLSTRHQRRHNEAMNRINEEGEESDIDDDTDMKDSAGPMDLYCNNQDDENEAWVYKHLRSGREELAYVKQSQKTSDSTTNNDMNDQSDNNHSGDDGEHKQKKMRASTNDKQAKNGTNNQEGTLEAKHKQHSSSTPQNNPQLQQALLLKPRTSDAVLSCPRCFNIVCMDCQQHEKYANQYRAMFVMNIGVDWNKRMVWDEHIGEIKLASSVVGNRGENDTTMQDVNNVNNGPDAIPHDNTTVDQLHDHLNKELYYSVHCTYCNYEVAALDKDEIYHFYGCIPSA